MKDELCRKIQGVLDRRISNEKQVVYLLVETRKLMDREQYQDPVLTTFCNWVVHTSLDRRGEGSTSILREFDHYFSQVLDHGVQPKRIAHLSLGEFYDSLTKFFRQFHLRPNHLKTLAEWRKFSALYCAIVGECPIVHSASREDLKYVSQVELSGISSGLFTKERFVVNWRITFRDGRVWDWGFHFG